MTVQFNRSLEGIEAERASLAEITDHAKAIPSAVDSLAELLKMLHHEVEEMKRHLEAFQHLRTQAGEAFPVIERNIKSLTEGVSEVVQDQS